MIIPDLPDKKYFYIGEVSELLNIKTHILRYWEQEFSFLKPKKTKTGHRLYTKKDILLIARIYELLYIEKYTIEGAKKKIKKELNHSSVSILEKNYYLERLKLTKKKLKDILYFINKNF